MPAKPYRITMDDGISTLGVINVGRFPLHQFAHEFDEANCSRYPLHLRFAGYDHWSHGCYRIRRNSDTFALEFVREGTMRFTQNGKQHLVNPGEIFIVQEKLDSEIECESARVIKQTVSIGGPLLDRLIEVTRLNRQSHIVLSDPKLFVPLFEEAHHLLDQRQEGYLLAGAELAYKLLLLLSAELSQTQFPSPLPELLNYINRHLSRSLPLQTLCREFGISRSSLHRLFVDHLGQSAGEYIIATRISAAQNLLASTEYPIKEIASRTGYSNQLYFASEFKRVTGKTPSSYRHSKKMITQEDN